MNDILLRIRKLITEKNISDSAFAKSIGLIQSTFSSFFQRNSIPKADIMRNISDEYGVNLNWLITGEGEMFLSKDPEDKDDFPEDPEQGAAMLDHLLNLLIKKGLIEQSDIPPPLSGVRRVNYADKMTKETYRMFQRQLTKAQREAERAQREAEHAQKEAERIEKKMARYEARHSESDEASEPAREYETRKNYLTLEEKYGSSDEDKIAVIPFVGRIAAGPPLNIEGWPDEWARIIVRQRESPKTHYLLEVTGTSMSEVDIPDGSLILVRRNQMAESGQIAVVYMPGDGVTLKRIRYTHEGLATLEWQDGSGRSRELGEEDMIQGIFVRVVQRYEMVDILEE